MDFNLFDGLRFEQISDLKKRNTDAKISGTYTPGYGICSFSTMGRAL